MILKQEPEKKKFLPKFTIFLYFYFFISLVVGLILIIAFFQSQFFVNKRNNLLDLFSKAGRYEYLYLPQLAFKAFKANFIKFQSFNTDEIIVESAEKAKYQKQTTGSNENQYEIGKKADAGAAASAIGSV